MINNDYDQISRSLFDSFKNGELTRQEYHNKMNGLYKVIPESLRSNINRRLDRSKKWKGRTLGFFALSIYDSSVRERILIDKWIGSALKIGLFSTCQVYDNGVENSGVVYISKQANASNSDFIIETTGPIEGKFPLELKFCPTLDKVSYKKADLESYIKQNALILTIFSPQKMIGPNGNPDLPNLSIDSESLTMLKWTLFGSRTIAKMLDTIPIKPIWELGNKDGVQIRAKDFHNFLEIYDI